MPSIYLQSTDYAAYGVPDATAALVQRASGQVDGYLRRPEGLIYQTDSAGNPCYMQAATPDLTLTAAASIAPGANVTVAVSGPAAVLQTGDVLILDPAGSPEAVVVLSVTGQSVMLQAVVNSHASGITMQRGLVITEQRYLPENRPLTTLGRTPVLRVISGTGRYGYGRRGDQARFNLEEFNLLATLSHFGGPPAWEVFNPQAAAIDPMTGQLWVPAGVMLSYYTEVRVRYVAGWTAATLPSDVKQATANLVRAMIDTPMGGNMRRVNVGNASLERFGPTSIDEDTKDLLAPYRARLAV